MADAKARAAARRQAILASKSDRLAKLTTKAKNEGDVAGTVREMSSDPPLAELPSHSSTNTPERRQMAFSTSSGPHPEFDGYGNEDSFPLGQDQLLRLQALLAASSREGTPQFSSAPGVMTDFGSGPFSMPMDLPNNAQRPAESKSLIEKLLPLLHISSTALFLILVLWRSGAFSSEGKLLNIPYWRQWADLQYHRPAYSWSGDSQHVLWSYMILQVLLHTTRIVMHLSTPRTPVFLDLVLPHLPPPLPVFIQTAFRYMNMLGLLADDLSLLIFAIGVLVFSASYLF